ncbi:MAG: VWD domain-containing protein [Brumimicrobium sp.]|nr:VWD domain-containing protein [Brumimicrobium sp.]
MKRILYIFIALLMVPFFGFSEETNPDKSYPERRDSDHIKEIFEAWNDQEGPWLYESMAAIVTGVQHPERPMSVSSTTFELLQKMDDNRKKRVERIAETELENERNGSGVEESNMFWSRWLQLLRLSNCESSNANSNGDPHMRTFDGEKYDFQTAGDYLLTSSIDESFLIQTQQVRHSDKISVIGAAYLNINGDEVELFAQNHPDEFTNKIMRVNGQVVENERAEIILEHGGVIRFENGRNVVHWPTGEQLQFSVRSFQQSQLLDLFVFVPECNDSYVGLLGNNNGERGDDITVRDENGAIVSTREAANRTFDDVFGAGRKNKANRQKQEAEGRFIAREFGDQFMLDETNSRFTNPLVNLSEEERYPSEHLTLADLTDEEVEEALAKCREAGVAEEDLFECAFDYAYVGLEPLRKPEYIRKKEIKERTEPEVKETKEQNANNNQNIPQIRIGTGVFRPIGSPQPRTSPRPTGGRNVEINTPRGGR